MPKTVWTGTLAAVVCTAGLALSAQTYPPSQSPASPSPQSSMSSDQDKGQAVTVTGCIERSSQSAVGTSGSTSTTGSTTSSSTTMSKSKSTGFLLTNVTAGTSGDTAAAPSTASTAMSYRLDGNETELAPHVGHKVEITGRVASSEAAATTPSREPGAPNPSAAPSATASAQASAPKLKVESVKMIAESCSK